MKALPRRAAIGTPTGLSPNTGPLASAAWFVSLELAPRARWWVEVALESEDGGGQVARLQLEIYTEEWGFRFDHAGRASWIRITDIPFVHGRDECELLRETPPLRHIGRLVEMLEVRYGTAFDRSAAVIRTSMLDSVTKIREWIATL